MQELYSEFTPAPLPDTGPRKPVLISFHDDMSRRLNHIKAVYGFDPMKAELQVLDCTNIARSLLACRKPLDPKVEAERAVRFHKLLAYCSRQNHISTAGTMVISTDENENHLLTTKLHCVPKNGTFLLFD